MQEFGYLGWVLLPQGNQVPHLGSISQLGLDKNIFALDIQTCCFILSKEWAVWNIRYLFLEKKIISSVPIFI